MEDEEVLSNESEVYTTEEGGIVPYELGEHHVKHCDSVINKALDEADTSIQDIDFIAFSQSPGIGHSLRVGGLAAKSLAVQYDKPLVGVNHCIAHLEIGKKTGTKDPVLLYASGANTQIISYASGKYRIFGETLDQGTGNFIDKFAR